MIVEAVILLLLRNCYNTFSHKHLVGQLHRVYQEDSFWENIKLRLHN